METQLAQHPAANLNSLYSYGNSKVLSSPSLEYSVQIYIPHKASVYFYLQDEENNIIMNIINGEILEEGFYNQKINLTDLPKGIYHYTIMINGDCHIKTLYLRK